MAHSRRKVLASVAAVAGAAVVATRAAAQQSHTPQVFTGSEIGFRMDRMGADGAAVGTLVVRVQGKWVAAQFQPGLHRGQSA